MSGFTSESEDARVRQRWPWLGMHGGLSLGPFVGKWKQQELGVTIPATVVGPNPPDVNASERLGSLANLGSNADLAAVL